MHKGYFERAHGGTLFLDEITEAVDIQVRLLRALETSAITRVGGTETIKVDVRIVAATSRRVEEAVAAGKLREDLFYRLNVFPIQLPPLRERGDDIELLAEKFLGDLNAGRRHEQALHPGVPRSAAPTRLARQRARAPQRRPPRLHPRRGRGGRRFPSPRHSRKGRSTTSLITRLGSSIAEVERRLILATLEHCDGDKKKAADVLKISLKTLYNRLNEYKAG